tara:strand:+ start:1005 stop:1373 length:369 start_codon:yes stop_codon:yes gene_type:complete
MHQVESSRGGLCPPSKMTFKEFGRSAGRGYVEGSKRAMKRGEKAGKTLANVGRSAGNVGRKVIGESRFEPYKKRTGIYEEITKKGKKKLVKKKRKTGFEGAGTTKGIKKVKDPRTLMEQAFR